MARLHTRTRGSSSSEKPLLDEPPEWSETDEEAITEKILELADDELSTSEIGIKLRDEGIKGKPVPDVQLATGKKIEAILRENNEEPEIPEDLENLLEKALRLHRHLDENKTDASNTRALQNVESKIRRFVDYYRGKKLPEDFVYTREQAEKLLEQR